jgi:hypothetical protein
MKTGDFGGELPGEALVKAGLADLQANRCTIASCLVEIARSRLSRAGLLLDSVGQAQLEPELRLYRLLRKEGGDAYSRYNALVRELVSFAQALETRKRRSAEDRHSTADFADNTDGRANGGGFVSRPA